MMSFLSLNSPFFFYQNNNQILFNCLSRNPFTIYIYMILFSTGNIISASPEIKVDQRNQSTGHVEQRESNLTSLNLMEKHTMLLSLPTLHN
jgi:hypothetical protein